ncbi:hypothetical protein Tco_0559769 [Tanacetum coccineum]
MNIHSFSQSVICYSSIVCFTMSVTAAVNYSAIEVKGNIGPTKVKRYWHGKASDWADDHVGTDHEDNNYIHMLGSVYDRRLSRLRKNYEGIVSNVKEEKMEVEIG